MAAGRHITNAHCSSKQSDHYGTTACGLVYLTWGVRYSLPKIFPQRRKGDVSTCVRVLCHTERHAACEIKKSPTILIGPKVMKSAHRRFVVKSRHAQRVMERILSKLGGFKLRESNKRLCASCNRLEKRYGDHKRLLQTFSVQK